MALIYGLMRAVAAAMTRLAMWQNHRAMKKLEVADSQFRKTETDCKADEVAVGRPADYPTQIRLLREFEKREAAHASWTRAANRLKKRKRFQRWLVKLSGRKNPLHVRFNRYGVGHEIDRSGLSLPLEFRCDERLGCRTVLIGLALLKFTSSAGPLGPGFSSFERLNRVS